MTLIVAANSDGVYGRCDAKCHDAREPKCDCICGGVYHGKGSDTPELRQAIEEWFGEVTTALRASGFKLEIPVAIAQRELF